MFSERSDSRCDDSYTYYIFSDITILTQTSSMTVQIIHLVYNLLLFETAASVTMNPISFLILGSFRLALF